MSDQWDTLSARQLKILSVSGKLAKMEGVFIGWYVSTHMSGNADAARLAFDMKTEASIAHKQFIEIANGEPTAK